MTKITSKLKKCPMCGEDKWEVFNRTVAAMEIDTVSKNIIMGKVGQPKHEVVCQECGYIAQFDERFIK
jgi:rubrerythrin